MNRYYEILEVGCEEGKECRVMMEGMTKTIKRRLKRSLKRWSWGEWLMIGFVGLVVAAIGWRQYRQSFVSWQRGRINLAIVYQGGPIEVISFDFVGKKVTQLSWDKDLWLRGYKTIGGWQVSKLRDLAKGEKDELGFLRARLQSVMLISIDRVVVVDNGQQQSFGRVIWREKSDLTLWEKILLWWRSKSFLWQRITEKDLLREGIIKAGNINWQRLNEWVKQNLFDWYLARVEESVEVRDRSGQDLGWGVAKLMVNMGLEVIQVKDDRQVQEKSEILVSKQVVTKQKWLKRSLRETLRISNIRESQGEQEARLADIVVVVGKDWASNF